MKGRGKSGWGPGPMDAVCSKIQNLTDVFVWDAERRSGGNGAHNLERGGLG